MKYFTLKELSSSTVAASNGIDNTPSIENMNNLTRLCNNVLDPLRQSWGSNITVNSGYRCKRLNELVKGSATSQHMQGMAADISAGSKAENIKLFKLAKSLNIPFDQLILENGGSWVHVSHREKGNRGQALELKAF